MTYDESFSDKQKVKIALQEYEIKRVNQEIELSDETYVGTISQIYDNVHDNEEQAFIFTNF
ncbi:hypothetical protein FFV08_08400 [Streptococcus sanguinis]|uniref:Uncharacterized protein n=1 Tax=Streptococcus sanguinis TaxID=1305 RepID=A0A7H8V7T7_STRSA|nr:hypothetical protein FFV08_08400 [Streptococcus sanguinis]